jgi:hypothetical protein
MCRPIRRLVSLNLHRYGVGGFKDKPARPSNEEARERAAKGGGLHALHSVYPQPESAWFQPSKLKCDRALSGFRNLISWFSFILFFFKCNLCRCVKAASSTRSA